MEFLKFSSFLKGNYITVHIKNLLKVEALNWFIFIT